MKNKLEPSTFVLLLLMIMTTIFNVVSDNAELLGISSKALMIISLVLSTAKLIYDQFKKFSEDDMLDFAQYYKRNVTKVDEGTIDRWKKYK